MSDHSPEVALLLKLVGIEPADVDVGEVKKNAEEGPVEATQKRQNPVAGNLDHVKKTIGKARKIKYMESKKFRATTYSKRRLSLFKKVEELVALTGSQCLLLTTSETGTIFNYTSPKMAAFLQNEEVKKFLKYCLTDEATASGVDSVDCNFAPSNSAYINKAKEQISVEKRLRRMKQDVIDGVASSEGMTETGSGNEDQLDEDSGASSDEN